ncbi:hypothetical protein SDC9_204812 [bioreactor metagenome]|uniref:Uncharacterized protein n=1 Tax=bioreactor metagenome TaxID=1076179 RepID=A0A645J0B0_9ZZZZ
MVLPTYNITKNTFGRLRHGLSKREFEAALPMEGKDRSHCDHTGQKQRGFVAGVYTGRGGAVLGDTEGCQ